MKRLPFSPPPEGALRAAEIARDYGLGEKLTKAAARKELENIISAERWNTYLDPEGDNSFATRRLVLRLVNDWKLDPADHDMACEAIFRKQGRDWYKDVVVLRACGGDVTPTEKLSLRFEAARVRSYLYPETVRFLASLDPDDLVRFTRAEVAHCDQELFPPCSRDSLRDCAVPDAIERIGIYECGQTWLHVAAVTPDPSAREEAVKTALVFILLEAKSWTDAMRLDNPSERSGHDLAVRAADQALALIRVEGSNLPNAARPFEQLLRDLQ